MIASILMAIGMAIGVLVEALLPGGGGAVEPPSTKDEKGVKEWLRTKLKALASLPGRSGMKAAEALAGINWSDHQMDSQQRERGSGLGITKLMGVGCRYWRITLYVYGNQKVIILRHIVI